MKPGVITVFLSIVLTCVLSLVGALIYSVRYSTARMRTEMVMNMGLQSVFAEYNRELLKQYDLYFIDTSYGGAKPSVSALKDHLRSYMDYNLHPAKGLIMWDAADMTGLSLSELDVDLLSYATDQGGRVFKRQAIHSLKDHYGISIVNELRKNLTDYKHSGIDKMDVDREREKVAKKLEGLDLNQGNYPAAKVLDQRAGILNLLINKELKVSDKALNLDNTASHRSNQSGIGLVRPDEDPDSMANELLFNEYLNWKLSCYTNDLGHSSASYELEYVLNGKNTDRANLRDTLQTLFIMREAADTMAVFQDEVKKNEAKGVGMALALILLTPELEEPITDFILFAWGFAESVMDIRTLLKGGRVPLIKGAGDWQLRSVGDLLLFNSKSPQTKGQGLSYQDYLKLLLALENPTKKVKRALDVIEMNIRTTEGNSAFRMDGCAEYLEAEAKLNSSYGFSFEIRRDYGYEPVIE